MLAGASPAEADAHIARFAGERDERGHVEGEAELSAHGMPEPDLGTAQRESGRWVKLATFTAVSRSASSPANPSLHAAEAAGGR
jgi:hypothetical protein